LVSRDDHGRKQENEQTNHGHLFSPSSTQIPHYHEILNPVCSEVILILLFSLFLWSRSELVPGGLLFNHSAKFLSRSRSDSDLSIPKDRFEYGSARPILFHRFAERLNGPDTILALRACVSSRQTSSDRVTARCPSISRVIQFPASLSV
jgi:hypothetical protein